MSQNARILGYSELRMKQFRHNFTLLEILVAVAVLADMACIVLPEDIEMEKEVLDKAVGEGIVVLTSPLTSYEISGRMYGQGIPAHN